jgi:hypothetical protein
MPIKLDGTIGNTVNQKLKNSGAIKNENVDARHVLGCKGKQQNPAIVRENNSSTARRYLM